MSLAYAELMPFVFVGLAIIVVVVVAKRRRQLPPRVLDPEMGWEHHDCGGPDVED